MSKKPQRLIVRERRHEADAGAALDAIDQILSNGNFAAFTGAVPDGWAVSGCTTSKDTRSGWFERPQGWACRVVATGAGTVITVAAGASRSPCSAERGAAAHTIEAYTRDLSEFLAFLAAKDKGKVSGTITVTNPNDWEAVTADASQQPDRVAFADLRDIEPCFRAPRPGADRLGARLRRGRL